MSSNGAKSKRVGALSSRLFKSEKSLKNFFESSTSSVRAHHFCPAHLARLRQHGP